MQNRWLVPRMRAKWSLQARERVRTPVMCGEDVRHPQHTQEVGLSRLTRSHMLNIGNHLPMLYARRRLVQCMPNALNAKVLKCHVWKLNVLSMRSAMLPVFRTERTLVRKNSRQ